jgi:5,10-methylenetetrahydrofolate reductase
MDMSLERSLDAWIDSNHFIRKVTSLNRFVFMTDGSTGRREEQNLRHVIINLGNEADHSMIVPILTAKHPLEYCLEFAERAYAIGFRSLVVLGGDRSDVVPRCVEHAYQLRKLIRERVPGLTLGGWANPHGGIKQVEFMVDPDYSADFYLAQIVSHYQTDGLDKFLDECVVRGVQIPGVFGVFYYRSANPKTLNVLKTFFPVPVDELKADFDSGRSAEDVCAQSIKTLLQRGVNNIYVSNLPDIDVEGRLGRIENLVSIPAF